MVYLMAVLGLALWIVLAALTARLAWNRGHSALVGFLIGLIPVVGLLVVWWWPPNRPESRERDEEEQEEQHRERVTALEERDAEQRRHDMERPA